ncbi:MAG: hypothetical protein K1X57_11695 [Gemmataceae bacterium]|nr:hypothetical protein [Gemmataceae bacterium]
MISHARFGKLRLTRFRPDADIEGVSGWELMDQLWVGEKVGFSEWLRLESDPEALRSLAIDFAEFPAAEAGAVLQTLDLPVRAGMSALELRALLGELAEELRFLADRVTYEFAVAGPPRYNVSCTVLNDGGLSYLMVMRP